MNLIQFFLVCTLFSFLFYGRSENSKFEKNLTNKGPDYCLCGCTLYETAGIIHSSLLKCLNQNVIWRLIFPFSYSGMVKIKIKFTKVEINQQPIVKTWMKIKNGTQVNARNLLLIDTNMHIFEEDEMVHIISNNSSLDVGIPNRHNIHNYIFIKSTDYIVIEFIPPFNHFFANQNEFQFTATYQFEEVSEDVSVINKEKNEKRSLTRIEKLNNNNIKFVFIIILIFVVAATTLFALLYRLRQVKVQKYRSTLHSNIENSVYSKFQTII
ncbi:hypothetical protein A3Q56_00321 [Intoshia linei]|uniref:CUB domain-containing protein n=1 Tax=Intoshia linei TaxID=1819745 RepID=A0A177BEB9_9BILA|nr:hypothetical protein A3Q56_00321 [Intoshia linei]